MATAPVIGGPLSTTTTTSSSSSSPTTTTTPAVPPTSTTATSTSSSTSPTTTASTTASTTSTTSATNTSNTSTTAAATVPVVVTTPNTAANSIIPVVTQVSTTFISETPTSSTTSTPGVASHGKSFFQNTGAVAGVFTVVGLIGLVILAFLITNTIRRRRARDFDKELIAATREAAATAPNPNFLDDEEDPEDRFKRTGYGISSAYNGNGAGGGGGGGYSDVSHGTYGQPPMEAYNMRDLGGHGPAVGEIYDPYAAGGAAGIGVARARSMRVDPANANPNTYAAALQEGGAPYPKFAIGPHETYGMRSPNNMEVAGMISHGQHQQYQQGPPPSQPYPTLARNKSSSTAVTHSSQLQAPSYHSHNPQQQPYSTPPPQAIHSPPPSTYPANFPHPQSYAQATAEPSAGADDGDDAYGGYVVESPTVRNNSVGHGHSQSGSMPNPFGRESSPEVEDRRSESEEEREEPRRVLKVANE